MSDEIQNTVIEGSKTVGSTGGLLALVYMVVNIFKKKVEVNDEREAKALEAMVAEQKITNSGIASLTSKVDVMNERLSGVLARVDRHEEKIEALQLEVAELKGALKHFQEQLLK